MLVFTLRVLSALIEERWQALDCNRLPLGQHVRMDLLIAGDLRDGPLSAQDCLHEFGFEGWEKRSSLHSFPL